MRTPHPTLGTTSGISAYPGTSGTSSGAVICLGDSGTQTPQPSTLREFRPDWPQTCDTCRGVGLIGGHGDQRACPDCKGTGFPTCHICHKPKDGPGDLYCSAGHPVAE